MKNVKISNGVNPIKPQSLRKGDKIGIISPSEPIIYKKKFLRGIETLKKLGFQVILGKNVFKEYGAYMAGTEKQRANDLNAMFRNPEIKGIFCSRGGFNSNQILNLIKYDTIKKNPKVFMGLSDITVLLNAIYKKSGLITFHGQNVEFGFSRSFSGINEYTYEYFSKAVINNNPIGKIKNWRKMEVLKKGKVSGKLIGGNLESLMALIGTEYEPDWKNKILFWEEDGNTTEDMDFYLTHLKLCGAFEKISGMVIGKITNYNTLEPGDDWKKEKVLPFAKIILNACRDYKFPIVKNVSFGHFYPQITLPIGVKATIDTSKKIFSIDENGVK